MIVELLFHEKIYVFGRVLVAVAKILYFQGISQLICL